MITEFIEEKENNLNFELCDNSVNLSYLSAEELVGNKGT